MNIDELYNNIMSGNGSIINENSISMLNTKAMNLYNKDKLNKHEVLELEKIIRCCNILYNRTDMTVLPIEDGFYDLLLEKYKLYNPNFQVGSAVVNLNNLPNTQLDSNDKVIRSPISFYEKRERDELHQSVYDQIIRKGQQILNRDDYTRSPISFSNDYINKRSHNTEHNHPSLVGTLDKCKFVLNQDAINAGVFNDTNVKVLERDFFQYHIDKGIIHPNQKLSIVCELKYDGISVEADCNTNVISARTRGDTGIGQASDITPILQGYPFKHALPILETIGSCGVKFEAIMTTSNLYKFNILKNKSYANCRSAIVGLFGSSDAYLYRDLITLVPLAIDMDDCPFKFNNRIEEIEFLNKIFVSHGQPLRYCYFEGTVPELLYLVKCFWDEAMIARQYLDFMYDGIVVSYVDESIRTKLGRKNYINKYSMAVKFNPLEKQTIFRGYTYEVGQHGAITPMIHYDPVEFNGTIHNKSTGSSYDRISSLKLKYGDYITVTYVNDVMPYVSRCECEHNRNNPNPVLQFTDTCPICGSKLVYSNSGKMVLCPNKDCAGRNIQRMVNMFAKMNIKGFSDATFNALPDMDHLYKLYTRNQRYYEIRLGDADGKAFATAIQSIIDGPTKDYIILGALGFTSIASRKWESILEYITLKDLYTLYHSCFGKDEFRMILINKIPKIGDATCNTIVSEFDFFDKDIEFIINNVNLINSYGSKSSNKIQIRFSGFRNSQLCEQLSTEGFDADDNASVTNNTDILLVPYDGFISTKVTKAKKNSKTRIIPIQEFLANKETYLSK